MLRDRWRKKGEEDGKEKCVCCGFKASCVYDEVSWEFFRGPDFMNACRHDAQGQLGGLRGRGASGKLCEVVSGGFGQMRCSIEGCYLRDAEKREGRRGG